MSRRTDITSTLIIGAGPVIIGQAAEFDYSGTQAVKALRAEGYRIVLVNSNPATIMTDPEIADATYIEPITPAVVAKIIEAERPDALLPTMGGQTALNTALSLFHDGTLARFGVRKQILPHEHAVLVGAYPGVDRPAARGIHRGVVPCEGRGQPLAPIAFRREVVASNENMRSSPTTTDSRAECSAMSLDGRNGAERPGRVR